MACAVFRGIRPLHWLLSCGLLMGTGCGGSPEVAKTTPANPAAKPGGNPMPILPTTPPPEPRPAILGTNPKPVTIPPGGTLNPGPQHPRPAPAGPPTTPNQTPTGVATRPQPSTRPRPIQPSDIPTTVSDRFSLPAASEKRFEPPTGTIEAVVAWTKELDYVFPNSESKADAEKLAIERLYAKLRGFEKIMADSKSADDRVDTVLCVYNGLSFSLNIPRPEYLKIVQTIPAICAKDADPTIAAFGKLYQAIFKRLLSAGPGSGPMGLPPEIVEQFNAMIDSSLSAGGKRHLLCELALEPLAGPGGGGAASELIKKYETAFEVSYLGHRKLNFQTINGWFTDFLLAGATVDKFDDIVSRLEFRLSDKVGTKTSPPIVAKWFAHIEQYLSNAGRKPDAARVKLAAEKFLKKYPTGEPSLAVAKKAGTSAEPNKNPKITLPTPPPMPEPEDKRFAVPKTGTPAELLKWAAAVEKIKVVGPEGEAIGIPFEPNAAFVTVADRIMADPAATEAERIKAVLLKVTAMYNAKFPKYVKITNHWDHFLQVCSADPSPTIAAFGVAATELKKYNDVYKTGPAPRGGFPQNPLLMKNFEELAKAAKKSEDVLVLCILIARLPNADDVPIDGPVMRALIEAAEKNFPPGAK